MSFAARATAVLAVAAILPPPDGPRGRGRRRTHYPAHRAPQLAAPVASLPSRSRLYPAASAPAQVPQPDRGPVCRGAGLQQTSHLTICQAPPHAARPKYAHDEHSHPPARSARGGGSAARPRRRGAQPASCRPVGRAPSPIHPPLLRGGGRIRLLPLSA
eukprot:scaffold552_cov526-Prasinococcus_capsulatus_cf.AAC.14